MYDLLRFAEGTFEKTRLRLLKVLLERELCVCEVSALFKLSQPRASQHLRALLRAGAVRERREGKWVYYRADPASIEAFNRSWQEFLGARLENLPEFSAEYGLLQSEELAKLRASCAGTRPGKRRPPRAG